MKWLLFGGCATLFISEAGGLYDEKRHIESARLYGNIDAYAYYFVDLIVGTPPQRASVILDTGSGLLAFPCAGCPHCGKHIDPNFDVSKSSTFSWVKCGTAQCQGSCKSGHCSYHQGYQEGSAISGYWFQDQVRLGDAIQRNPAITAKMGCHQNENKLFYTQRANGIFGIQGTRSLLQLLFADKAHVESKIFAICLAEWGGRLTVGGYNASYHRAAVQYVPQLSSRYSVPLSSMEVNGQTITNFRSAVIDSGTTYTYMGSSPYKALRGAIEKHCSKKNCGRKSGTCYDVPGVYAQLKEFPTVKVMFNAVVTFWEPEAYLYRKGNSKQFCYAFQDDGGGASTVLGASWMINQEIVFDLRNNKIGIVKAECPQYRDRPKHDISLLDHNSAPAAATKPIGKPALVTSTARPDPGRKPATSKAASAKPAAVTTAKPSEKPKPVTAKPAAEKLAVVTTTAKPTKKPKPAFAKPTVVATTAKPTKPAKPVLNPILSKPLRSKPAKSKPGGSKPEAASPVSAKSPKKSVAKASSSSISEAWREAPKSAEPGAQMPLTEKHGGSSIGDTLHVEWRNPGTRVLAIATSVVILGACVVSVCIARTISRSPNAPRKIYVEPAGIESKVVGAAFEIGDEAEDENAELVQKTPKEKAASRLGPLE